MSLKFQITSVLPALTLYDNILLALQAQTSLPRLVFSRTRGICTIARWRCSNNSGWWTARRIRPPRCRTASSNGLKSRWRWRPNQNCCCWTSRPAA